MKCVSMLLPNSRHCWMAAAVALVAGISVAIATAVQPLPPDSSFRGKTFDEWNTLAAENAISDFLGIGGLPDTVKKVRLLPGAQTPGPGGQNEFEFDVVLAPGTGFCIPPWFAFGEAYDDGTVDDPVALADLLAEILATTYVKTELDGKVLVEGTGAELADYYYGPTYFDAPVPYAEPQFRFEGEDGPVNAIAALWSIGVGSVYHPLPPGEHTLVHTHFSPFFGHEEPQILTYHIVVGK